MLNLLFGLVAALSADGEPNPLATQAALCAQTGGAWQAGWVHCICPQDSLFHVDTGCGPVAWSAGVHAVLNTPNLPPAALRRALHTLLRPGSGMQIVLDANQLTPTALQRWAAALRADPSRVLGGFTLPPAHAQHATVWILTPPDARSRQEVERELPVGPAQVIALDPFFAGTHIDAERPLAMPPPAVDPAWMDAVWWGDPSALPPARSGAASPAMQPPAAWSEQLCAQSLAATAMPLTSLTQLCSSTQAAWRHLQDPNAATWPLGPVQQGLRWDTPPGAGESTLAMQFLGANVAVYYSVVLADGVPVRRVLRAGSPLGHELMLFLSPSGSIDSIVAKTRHVPAAGDGAPEATAVLRRERWLLDRAWRLVRQDTDTLGNRAQFNQALVGWQGRNRLTTDSAPRPTQATVVLMDTGVDPRLPGLRHRMQLAYGTSLEEHLLPLSNFTAPSSPALRALTLFDERGHGTRVAARLLANLPAARLHVLRGDDLGFVPAPLLQARWKDYLLAVQPQVVNISQDYSRLLPNCDSFFGPIVAALPNTLFVAGAGNDGAASAAGVCPAGLAGRYPNVLSVAGSNAAGTALDPLSNHGAHVSVAAPMEQPTVAFGSSEAAQFSGTADRAQGTSFAAAAVSNLALVRSAEAAGRGLKLSGAGLAAALLAQCLPGSLDVECGGALAVPPGVQP